MMKTSEATLREQLEETKKEIDRAKKELDTLIHEHRLHEQVTKMYFCQLQKSFKEMGGNHGS